MNSDSPLHYDVSGLLEVDLIANSTGKKSTLVVTRLAGEMSELEISAALKKLTRLKVHPRSEAENLHVVTRLETAYAQSRGEGREWVQSLLVAFDAAINGQDKPAIARLRDELHEALDRFEADYVR